MVGALVTAYPKQVVACDIAMWCVWLRVSMDMCVGLRVRTCYGDPAHFEVCATLYAVHLPHYMFLKQHH